LLLTWQEQRRFIFNPNLPELQMRSGTLVKVRAQFVDRRKPHHAFGHLCLDRAVGIQRIGHPINHA